MNSNKIREILIGDELTTVCDLNLHGLRLDQTHLQRTWGNAYPIASPQG